MVAADMTVSDASCQHSLLDLPYHVLLLILQQLDVVALCSLARCSRALHRLSGHQSLWPSCSHTSSDWALGDVQITLAHILKLPPQVFHAQLDVRRSRRFPVSVPMHNLRTILATSDAEGLADRVSRALQDRLARAQRNMWRHGSWQDLPPDASISICRADGATIRAALRPQAVVPRLVHHLQQAGWPPAKHQPKPAGRTGPAAHNSACTGDVSTVRDVLYAQRSLSSGGGCVSGSDCLVSECLPPGLVDVMHLCQQRMGLLRSQQLQQLQHLRKPSQPVQPGAKAGCVKGAAGWRPNMVALHTVLLKLPGDTAIRDFVSRSLGSAGCGDGMGDAATTLAMRLFWASIVADPSLLSYSAAGNSAQWQLPLAQAVRVVSKLQSLQQSCGQAKGMYSCSQPVSPAGVADAPQVVCASTQTLELDAHDSSMGAAWARAGQAELQLCQSGLQQWLVAISSEHNAACQPAPIYRCVQALDTAAGEYLSAYSKQDLLAALHTLELSHMELASQRGCASVLQAVMHREVVRALSWCLWLLGAL